MERALFNVDNAYRWESLHCSGTLCKTNLPSNTAFRGFGGPQGMLISETAVEHLAVALDIEPEVLRQRNLYQDDDITHYGMPVKGTQLPRLWDQVSTLASWQDRKQSVAEFNKQHRWRKRGTVGIVTHTLSLSLSHTHTMTSCCALISLTAFSACLFVHWFVQYFLMRRPLFRPNSGSHLVRIF